jgi:hypothetical protein
MLRMPQSSANGCARAVEAHIDTDVRRHPKRRARQPPQFGDVRLVSPTLAISATTIVSLLGSDPSVCKHRRATRGLSCRHQAATSSGAWSKDEMMNAGKHGNLGPVENGELRRFSRCRRTCSERYSSCRRLKVWSSTCGPHLCHHQPERFSVQRSGTADRGHTERDPRPGKRCSQLPPARLRRPSQGVVREPVIQKRRELPPLVILVFVIGRVALGHCCEGARNQARREKNPATPLCYTKKPAFY